MKILWTTNAPLNYIRNRYEFLDNKRGHWLSALFDEILSETFDDFIVVHFSTKVKVDIIHNDGRTTYFVAKCRKFAILDNFSLERKKFELILEKFSPDLIHIHGTEDFYGLVTAKAKYRDKTIVSIQGLRFKIWEKYFSDFPVYKYLLYSLVSFSFISFSSLYLWYLSMRNEKKVIERSKFFFTRTLFDTSAISITSPGSNILVDTDYRRIRTEFKEAIWRSNNEDRFSFSTVVSSSSFKGIFFLIEVISSLRRFYPLIRLSVIGKLTGIYLRRARHLVRKLQLEKNIIFCGSLEAREMLSIYSKSRGFLFCSYADNSSNSVQEAMLFGMPVACFFSGGNSSLVSDGVSGLLSPEGNKEYFSYLILRIIEDDSLCDFLGANARKKIVEMQGISLGKLYRNAYDSFSS